MRVRSEPSVVPSAGPTRPASARDWTPNAALTRSDCVSCVRSRSYARTAVSAPGRPPVAYRCFAGPRAPARVTSRRIPYPYNPSMELGGLCISLCMSVEASIPHAAVKVTTRPRQVTSLVAARGRHGSSRPISAADSRTRSSSGAPSPGETHRCPRRLHERRPLLVRLLGTQNSRVTPKQR